MLHKFYFDKEMYISYTKSFEKLDEIDKIVRKMELIE